MSGGGGLVGIHCGVCECVPLCMGQELDVVCANLVECLPGESVDVVWEIGAADHDGFVVREPECYCNGLAGSSLGHCGCDPFNHACGGGGGGETLAPSMKFFRCGGAKEDGNLVVLIYLVAGAFESVAVQQEVSCVLDAGDVDGFFA